MRELPVEFAGKPIREAGEQAPAAGEDDVAKQDLAKVHVAMVDRRHD